MPSDDTSSNGLLKVGIIGTIIVALCCFTPILVILFGAVGLAAFASAGDRAVPLVVRSEIRYLKLAKGDLRAEAVLTRPAGEVLAELDAGTRPEFAVDVTITDAQGVQTGAMTIVWTLKPNRR